MLCTIAYMLYAQHSIEIGYTAGMNNHKFKAANGTVASTLLSGGIAYKYITKKGMGLSFGIDASGYNISPQSLNSSKFTSYRNLHNRYIYVATPIMLEVRGGKKKVQFGMHVGLVAMYGMYYRLQYTYSESTPPMGPYPATEKITITDITYTDFKLIQIGLPLGIGAHINLSPRYYLEVSAEDRLLLGRIPKTEGLINTFGLRLALGINAIKKPKEPKQ